VLCVPAEEKEAQTVTAVENASPTVKVAGAKKAKKPRKTKQGE
jgi:hypothetical protein